MRLSHMISMAARLAGLAAIQSVSFAAPPTDGEIAECRAQADGSSRLACYDHLFGGSVAPVGGTTALPASLTPAPAAAAPVAAHFGFGRQAPGQESPKSLAFVVARVDRRPAGEFIVTFDNGQVWQQIELNTKIDIERGEQVVIRKAALGSFLLVSRAGLSTRVKRVR